MTMDYEPVHTPPLMRRGRRIGLLGGSFNPAHDGHVEISRLAKRFLNLDEVWWLVSPQNPLKAATGMASLSERVKAAEALTTREHIRVTDIEAGLGTRYTADTVKALSTIYPGARFVWLMGADNLLQIHRWHGWRSIFRMVPVAVFARPTYALKAERTIAARRFARFRVQQHRAGNLADRKAPAWVLFTEPHNPMSATKLRARGFAHNR